MRTEMFVAVVPFTLNNERHDIEHTHVRVGGNYLASEKSFVLSFCAGVSLPDSWRYIPMFSPLEDNPTVPMARDNKKKVAELREKAFREIESKSGPAYESFLAFLEKKGIKLEQPAA